MSGGNATTAGAGRFAPQGLLRRRLFSSDSKGWYQAPSRAVDGVLRCPGTPLPSGLLPLPEGFELSRGSGLPAVPTTTTSAGPFHEAVAAGR
jgi:hypothetical protein